MGGVLAGGLPWWLSWPSLTIPAFYGDRWAEIYDERHAGLDPAAAVEFLAGLSDGADGTVRLAQLTLFACRFEAMPADRDRSTAHSERRYRVPSPRARRSCRVRAPVLVRMALRWSLAVCSDTTIRSAIWRVSRPSQSSARTSDWRRVNPQARA